MASCYADSAQMFVDGEWLDAIYCWLTSGGDPTLTVVVPTLIYGVVLVGMFVVGQSPVMPVVVSIILAGVIFAAFPASGITVILISIMLMLSIGGTLLTWRMGR